MQYLVFRLYGPIASWGEVAVGEARHSATYPGKSAVTGLVAAALGIRREQDELLLQVATGYKQAVKLVSSGRLLKDYHTAQAPDSVGNFRYRTRRDEVVHGHERLGTVLSSREYRTDALALVALEAMPNAKWTLDDIKQVLLKPKFHLYLGRKSCPLAAPLDPQLVDADGFLQALDNYPVQPLLMSLPSWATEQRWLVEDATEHYYWEGKVDDFAVNDSRFVSDQVQQLVRQDQPLSRKRWQFERRTEYLWLNKKETG